MLTARTIERRSPPLTNLFHRTVTSPAWFTRPIINCDIDLKPALTAVVMYIIPNTAAASRYRISQCCANRRHKQAITLKTDAVGRPQRRNTRPEETFGSINISHPNQQMAIHGLIGPARRRVASNSHSDVNSSSSGSMPMTVSKAGGGSLVGCQRTRPKRRGSPKRRICCARRIST